MMAWHDIPLTVNQQARLQALPWVQAGYLVGGAVRDVLLGRSCADADWLVLEPKVEAEAMAARVQGAVFALDEARAFYRVVSPEMTHDFTPLASLSLTALHDDLARRDFSINAMALRHDGALCDPHEGLAALRAKQVAMVSAQNLRADPLRLLRAVRFACQLEFRLETSTATTITQLAAQPTLVTQPAAERIRLELEKILCSPRAVAGIQHLESLGLLAAYLPELHACKDVQQGGFHHLDVLEHSLEALHQLLHGFPDASLALRWATLLHDIGKASCQREGEAGRYHFYGHDKAGAELCQQVLSRLKASHKQQQQVCALVRYHMLPLPSNAKEARRFVHKRAALLPDLLKLMLADRSAARGPLASDKARDRYKIAVSRVLDVYTQQQAHSPAPLLDGKAVMTLLGLRPGARVGEALRFVHEAQAVGDIKTRAEAEAALKHYAAKQGWMPH